MDIKYIFEDTRIHHTKYKLAPDDLTIFVDYGDGNSDTAFDHHASSEKACSTSLICSEKGLARLKSLFKDISQESLRIVTHSNPDLDSIAAATVVTRFAKNNPQPLSRHLVEYIRAKDQGEIVHEDIKQSIALLFQAMKNNRNNDMDIMIDGISLVEAIDCAIESGNLHLGWSDLINVSALRDSFCTELSAFDNAIENCQKILAKAPRTLLTLPCVKNGLQDFKWAEAIFLDFSKQSEEPLGWKDLIRSEKRLTMSGNPLPCMGVYSSKRNRDNYIFSVTPESGFSLKGFGAYIDAFEEQSSNELQTKGNFSQRIQEIANKRCDKGAPDLIRSIASPRSGYSNSDPWYDGRGHNYTIIDTPESGTVLEPSDILVAFLQRYSPFWKEHIRKEQAKCIRLDLGNASHSIVSDWLFQVIPQWDGTPQLKTVTNMKCSRYCLADLISSLANLNRDNCKYSIYVPIIPSSAQILPEENPNMHIQLAHYLIAHQGNPICTSLPLMKTLQTWVSKMVSSPLPGKLWSVSDNMGIVVFDYMPDENSKSQFDKITEQYFDLAKQLKWTDTLTTVIRQKKRYDALVEFVERSGLV